MIHFPFHLSHWFPLLFHARADNVRLSSRALVWQQRRHGNGRVNDAASANGGLPARRCCRKEIGNAGRVASCMFLVTAQLIKQRRKRKITPDSPDRHYARPLDSTGLDDHPIPPMAEPHQPDAAIARRYNKRQRISSPDASSTRSASASSASSSVPPVPAVRPGPPLSAQQEGILRDILAGKSVFVTGSAGTGKSVLIRAIIWEFAHRARQRRVREKVGEKVSKETWLLGVTSSTGLSALCVRSRSSCVMS